MSKDYSRKFLVTTFHCAKCGAPLNLTYEKPTKNLHNGYVNDGITGADKVENLIYIHPCEVCVDRLEEPIKALQAAFKTIGEAK
jgi:hypothetical protein